MRSRINQSAAAATFACAVLLGTVWIAGPAEGTVVPPPSLGNCVAGLEEEGEFAIEICRAKLARAVMTPGAARCTATMRLIRGRLICSKTDSASIAAGAGTRFAPFPIGINGPIAIGSPETFYAGKRAGANGRFRIVRGVGGNLRIEERVSASRSESKCTVASGLHNCETARGSNPAQAYTLQLDGLLVTETTFQRVCVAQTCLSWGNCFGCSRTALREIETTSRLHPWNE